MCIRDRDYRVDFGRQARDKGLHHWRDCLATIPVFHGPYELSTHTLVAAKHRGRLDCQQRRYYRWFELIRAGSAHAARWYAADDTFTSEDPHASDLTDQM